jgi:hypothetical protein
MAVEPNTLKTSCVLPPVVLYALGWQFYKPQREGMVTLLGKLHSLYAFGQFERVSLFSCPSVHVRVERRNPVSYRTITSISGLWGAYPTVIFIIDCSSSQQQQM